MKVAAPRSAIAALILAPAGATVAGCGDPTTSTSGDDGTAATAAGDASTATVTDCRGATLDENIDRPDTGTQVNQALGATFAIELSQSASTGYEGKQTGGTAESLMNLVEIDTSSTRDAPGSPVTIILAYRASAEGSGNLVFGGPPGKDTAPDSVTFDVSVEAPRRRSRTASQEEAVPL